MSRSSLLRVLPVAVAVVLAAGCANSGSGSGGSKGDLKTDYGVTADTIKVGVLTDLSGSNAAVARTNALGFESYMKKLNDAGGIAGRKIEVVVGDHKYDPQVAVQEYRRVADQVVAAHVYGTPPVMAILPMAVQDNMLMVPAAQDGKLLNSPNIVFIAPPYSVMIANAVDWIVQKEGKGVKIGVVYQNDDFGAEHRFGIDYAAKTNGIEIVATADASPTDKDFTAQVAAMRRAGAQYVITAGSPPIAVGVTATAAAQGYGVTTVAGGGSYAAVLLDTPAGPALEKQFISACVLAPWGTDVPGMKALIAAKDKYAPDQQPDFSFEYGYIQALVLSEVLRKAADNGDLTRQGVVTAFHQIKNMDTGGLTSPITYGSNPADRIPYREVRMCKAGRVPGGFIPISDEFVGPSGKSIGVRQ